MIRATWFVASSAVLLSIALLGPAGCSFSRANEEVLEDGSGGVTGSGGSGVIFPDAGDAAKLTSDAAQTCVTTTPQVASVPPDVLIVLDRSASMNDAIDGTTCRGGCGAQSKWVQMTNALEVFIPTVQSTVNWGLKLFASPAGSLCSVTTGAEVAPAASNAPAIMRAIGATSAASSTPTTAAELAAASYLMNLKDSNPKFILLATDGIPTCGTSACAPGVDSGGLPMSCDDANAIAAVKNVHDNLSIPTFVVGIGTATGGGDATLTAMA